MHARHFPGPWSVVDIPGGYRVQDATGHPLGYLYSWDDPAAFPRLTCLRGSKQGPWQMDLPDFRIHPNRPSGVDASQA